MRTGLAEKLQKLRKTAAIKVHPRRSSSASSPWDAAEDIERLRRSSVAAPAYFFQYLKRLETEPELQESFILDLFRLLGDEDGFDWPVDDLGRCLALAVFREQAKQRMDGWVVANRVTRTHPGP